MSPFSSVILTDKSEAESLSMTRIVKEIAKKIDYSLIFLGFKKAIHERNSFC